MNSEARKYKGSEELFAKETDDKTLNKMLAVGDKQNKLFCTMKVILMLHFLSVLSVPTSDTASVETPLAPS